MLGSGYLQAQDRADPTASNLVEVFCDYCADFTDQRTAAGPIKTAYQVGIGYASEPTSLPAHPCVGERSSFCKRLADRGR